LREVTSSLQQAPQKLDVELADLRQELRRREAEITKVRQKRKQVEGQSAEQARQRQRVRQIYLFVGRVEQALENVQASQNVEQLGVKVKALSEKISQLKRELDAHNKQRRTEAAIDSVSARIADYAKLLNLEHAKENVRLNIRELTLQFSPLSGRTDYLW